MSLETRFKGVLARFGYQVRRIPEGVWSRDEAFKKTLARALGRTLLDPASCYMLHQHALKAARLPGDCAELGVYRGGTALILAGVMDGAGKTVHLFDTFGGLPHPEAVDRHHAGDFGDATLSSVRELLKDGRVEFHPGLFPATGEPVRGVKFCLVHVDADLYRSTRDALEFFFPRLVPGGLLVVDDYGLPTCPGVMKAVDEFFDGRPERPLYLPSGQCVVEAGSAPPI